MTHGNSTYTPELGDKICALIAQGSNVNVIAQEEGMPPASTIYDWAYKNDDFSVKYARARELRADARSDRMDEYKLQTLNGTIAPDIARVVIDVEKWQAGREAPKRYGDKLQTENTHVHTLAGLIAESQKD